MNKNIQVLNKNLIAVNFEHINQGYITDIEFLDGQMSEFACLTKEGKILLNTNHDVYKKDLPLLNAVTNLSDEELHTDNGFVKVIRQSIPSLMRFKYREVRELIKKYELDKVQSVYMGFCELEKQRRINEKEYKKRKRFSKLLKRKGG